MFKGYKTVIFNLIAGTLGVLEISDLSFLPADYGKYVTVFVALGNLWLRTLTTGPIGEK